MVRGRTPTLWITSNNARPNTKGDLGCPDMTRTGKLNAELNNLIRPKPFLIFIGFLVLLAFEGHKLNLQLFQAEYYKCNRILTMRQLEKAASKIFNLPNTILHRKTCLRVKRVSSTLGLLSADLLWGWSGTYSIGGQLLPWKSVLACLRKIAIAVPSGILSLQAAWTKLVPQLLSTNHTINI